MEPSGEFLQLLSLPEEKIVDICDQMDDMTLARFLKVSNETKRICSKVLENRNTSYEDKIWDIINDSLINMSVNLQSLDPGRTFRLETHYLGGSGTESESDDESNSFYLLTEQVSNPDFALQKFTKKPIVLVYNTKEVSEIIEVLLDLIHRGYIKV